MGTSALLLRVARSSPSPSHSAPPHQHFHVDPLSRREVQRGVELFQAHLFLMDRDVVVAALALVAAAIDVEADAQRFAEIRLLRDVGERLVAEGAVYPV